MNPVGLWEKNCYQLLRCPCGAVGKNHYQLEKTLRAASLIMIFFPQPEGFFPTVIIYFELIMIFFHSPEGFFQLGFYFFICNYITDPLILIDGQCKHVYCNTVTFFTDQFLDINNKI